ncbi:(3S)-malyl-CoA thioesterase [Rhizobiales bacterium GAS191]|nr:(3S)-malyl-CoA thioesterase [Rhizobiales bacterium GAS191]
MTAAPAEPGQQQPGRRARLTPRRLTPQPLALHELTLRIYYEDTDFSGFVYHANYLRFMERGRTEWLRGLGIDQHAAFAMSPPLAFVVRRMTIDYLRPARMDDLVKVETGLVEMGGASLDLTQRVRRGEDTLVEANITVACVAGGRPVRLPRLIHEVLAARQGGD